MQIMNNIRSCANCRIKQSEKRKIDNFYIKARECRGLNIRVCCLNRIRNLNNRYKDAETHNQNRV